MQPEKQLEYYLKLLIKEHDDNVLSDPRYKDGDLDPGFIHDHYNVAVDRFLKRVSDFETKKISETDRLYYRGWIAAHLAMTLNLERQERFQEEYDDWQKERGKLEKEIQRLEDKNERLLEKIETLKERLSERKKKR